MAEDMEAVMGTIEAVKQRTLHTSDMILVGSYQIHIIGCCDAEEEYELPDMATRFLAEKPTYRQHWNLLYIIVPQNQPAVPDAEVVLVARFEDGPMPYRIYKEATGNYLWIRMNKDKSSCLEFRISRNWNVWELLYDCTAGRSPNYFEELAYIFPYSVLNKGGILFHGVVMEWNTLGILVCAHSGVGKTTHTGMWKEQEGAHILNGDRALCCREEEDWYTYGSPWNGSSNESINHKVMLKAIVILERAEDNQLLQLSRLQGSKELISLVFAPAWELELMNHALDRIDEITDHIPVYKLKCRPEAEAVALLKQELEKQYNIS